MNKQRRLVSILAGLMAAIMLLTLLAGILPVSASAAKSSKDIKEEINALKGDRTAIWAELEALESEQDATWESIEELVEQKGNIDQQIALLYEEIDNISSQIRSYTELIAANQEELDAAEAKLEALNEKNKERIQAMEEEGTVSYWSVLFKAKSFTDLIDRLNMMEEIHRADQKRMSELSEAAQAVAEARTALETEKVALEESRAELKESEAVLDAKRAEADELLNELNADKRALDALEDEWEAEEAKLSAEIAAAEVEYTKALKAEEEARRKAEEERKRREEEERKKQEEANKKPVSGGSNNGGSNNGGGSNDGGSSGGSFVSGESWARPCSWRKLTSPYGYRIHPTTGQYKFHNGVDLANDQGTPIYAARSGKVTVATYGGTYGNYVTINHGDGYSSLYAHMTRYVVHKGDTVKKGQLIGYMGSTGRSTGPHLHFSIFYNGSSVNPMNYI
ncbi:MAG: peptidoglycan DD-metalloendopeptidase family protein [Oscillospiraceae bacterium]|nr:peptidoglycan DD-metalloendopeptidase family protein [Oscillospiraceae bacterium]